MSENDPNREDEAKQRGVCFFFRSLQHLAAAECGRVPSTETLALVTQRARWMNVSNKGHMLLAPPNGPIVQILGAVIEGTVVVVSLCRHTQCAAKSLHSALKSSTARGGSGWR